MAAIQTAIKEAQELLRDKIIAKLRDKPKCWGKVTVEVTMQEGEIKTITAIENETIKPQSFLPH